MLRDFLSLDLFGIEMYFLRELGYLGHSFDKRVFYFLGHFFRSSFGIKELVRDLTFIRRRND